MSKYKYTDYFENEVLRKRPYLKKEWCEFVIENAVKSERDVQRLQPEPGSETVFVSKVIVIGL
jgi:hypothetical protein